MAIENNLQRARAVWGRISPVLKSDGVSPRCMGRFYLTIVQAVLLYSSESWVISRRLQRRLDTFHHRCARHMAHQHIRQRPDGTWQHPSSIEVLNTCGLFPISTYVDRRKSRILHRYAKPHSEVYARCLLLPSTSNRRTLWWNTQLDQ